MKILFVTKNLPYESNQSDHFRPYRFIKYLYSQGHEITLLSFCSSTDLSKKYLVAKYCNDVIVIEKRNNFFSNLMKFFRFLFSCYVPFRFIVYYDKVFKKSLIEIKTQSFDITYIFGIHLSIYAPYIKSKTVIDLVDSKYLNIKRNLAIRKKNLLYPIYYLEMLHVKIYEKNIKNKYNTILTSVIDEMAISSKKKSIIIPVILDEAYFKNYEKIECKNNKIIYVGNYNYFPNYDAVKYFLMRIYPLLINSNVEFELHIIGEGLPLSFMNKYKSYRKLVFRGFVNELINEYLSAKILAVPLRIGTGVKNKIIEAMALGLPVVCTTIGNEGIGAINGEHILLADSDEDFANNIITLLNNKDYYKYISINSKKFAHEKFNPLLLLNNFEKELLNCSKEGI